MSDQRIEYLDGLRGVAISSVVIYHAYSRWPEFTPFGDQYAHYFSEGWLGVELFFLISGFVILMTLEKCSGFTDFIVRRWRRLFPAMLVASAVLMACYLFLPVWPSGRMTLLNTVPGLTFIDSEWFGVEPLDGAFWSLFVEFKFYVFFGAAYFLFGERHAIILLCAVVVPRTIEAVIFKFGYPTDTIHQIVSGLNTIFGASYYSWFAAGAVFYLFHKTGELRYFIIAATIAVISAYLTPWTREGKLLAMLIVICFALPLIFEPAKRPFRSRLLVFIGFISYPLYLIHENIMIGLSQLLPSFGWISVLLPLIPISATAWLIARYAEPLIRSRLRLQKRISPNTHAGWSSLR